MNDMYAGLLPNEPILMPFQVEPLNSDKFACAEFLKLKKKFHIEAVVELGSCVGGSTKFFCNNYKFVHSIEINQTFLNFAKERCKGTTTEPTFYLGSTVDLLADVLKKCNDKTICFIDSHWMTLPLIQELKIIKASGLKPVIIVHDCLVPNEPKLGYDSYEGVDISYVTMKPYLDDIYGVDGYDYHYNSDAESTIVKRGIIYVYPKQ